MHKEFGIMNSFTIEASMHGYIESRYDREVIDLTIEKLE